MIRATPEFLRRVEDFREGQFAVPSKTAAIEALVRLGFEHWQTAHGSCGAKTKSAA